MMSKLRAAILSLAVTSGPAFAESNFSYTFVSLDYSIFSEEVDNVDDDFEGDGINIKAAFNVMPNLALFAGYGSSSGEVSGNGNTLRLEGDTVQIGAVLHAPANETVDVYGGYIRSKYNVDIKFNGTKEDDESANGNTIIAGLRAWASEKLELGASIDRTTYTNDSDSSTEFTVSGDFYLDKKLSVGASYSFDSDGNSINIGATKYF